MTDPETTTDDRETEYSTFPEVSTPSGTRKITESKLPSTG